MCIRDSYKNTQNVRRFFKAHADPNFKFNIAFMEWLKANVGKTLGDAAAYCQSQQDDKTTTKIKPHNQLNQYLRDFMADNPALGIEDARRAWALKKELPSETGRHRYERDDLGLLDAAKNDLEQRAQKGSRKKFLAALDKVPDSEPENYDRRP